MTKNINTQDSRTRLPELDFFRTIATLLVFAAHFYVVIGEMKRSTGSSFLDRVILNGSVGVDLFFVLSGFLLPFTIYTAKLKGTYSLTKYFKSRLTRIIPAYYFSLLIIILITPAFLITQHGIGNIITHFLFIHHFFPNYHASLSGVAWTLSVEMQFYLILPAIYAISFGSWRRITIMLGCSLLISWTWRYFMFQSGLTDIYEHIYVYDQIVGRIDQFGVGIFMSYLFSHHRQALERLPVALMTAIALLSCALYVVWLQYYTTHMPSIYSTMFSHTQLAAIFGCAMLSSLFMANILRRPQPSDK